MNIDLSEIIQVVVTLITGGGVYAALRQQLKSQTEHIEVMKSSIQSMKDYIDVFNPEDVDKHVAVMGKSHKIEGENEANEKWQKHFTEEIMPQLQEYQKNIQDLQFEKLSQQENFLLDNKETKDKYIELFNSAMVFSLLLPDDTREDTLKKLFPKNCQEMLEEIKNADPKALASAKQKLKNSISTQFYK